MRRTLLATAAVLLCGGVATALAQTPSGNPAGAAVNAPTLSSDAPQVQNPLVNPSAAGTQRKWRGYGSSSGAVGGHPVGSDNTGYTPGPTQGSVTPGAGEPFLSPANSPPAGRAATAFEARERLKQLGYSRISRLHRRGNDWVADALRGNQRRVWVTLDRAGDVVGERSAAR